MIHASPRTVKDGSHLITGMENLHLSQPVTYRGCDLESAKCIAIMIHGRDRDTDDILQVADRLNLADIAYVAPAAYGNSWYPDKFMEPLENNQPHLDHGLAVIDKLVNDVKGIGFNCRQLLFLGFSQGACLIAEYVLRNPVRYGGVIIFTGGYGGPADQERYFQGKLQGTPVFLGCSNQDEWVPESRVHETAAAMKNLGADVEVMIYEGDEHIINDDEIKKARKIFQSVREAG